MHALDGDVVRGQPVGPHLGEDTCIRLVLAYAFGPEYFPSRYSGSSSRSAAAYIPPEPRRGAHCYGP
ncbi:MAG: hypothetical protein M3R66_17825 [Actinomycetota bacterium]|nr:hypothetical protein [Actinomycetota bacterium]